MFFDNTGRTLCFTKSMVIHSVSNILTKQFIFIFVYRSETFKVHYLMFLLVSLKALDVLLNAVSHDRFILF
jgi:hypothetical protein